MGYHATVPCKKEEAGYRLFDNVFVVDRSPSTEDVVVIKYMHSMVRDQVSPLPFVDDNIVKKH